MSDEWEAQSLRGLACDIADDFCGGSDAITEVLICKIGEFIRQRELAAQAAALEAAAKVTESNATKPGEIIETQGDVQTFVAGMNESMRRIYKGIRALITTDQRTALQAALDAARLEEAEWWLKKIGIYVCNDEKCTVGKCVRVHDLRVRASRETSK